MKLAHPSLPLLLLAGAFASACGGATEINYVEESGGTAGDGGNGAAGNGGSGFGGAGGSSGGSNSGGSSSGGSAGDTTNSGGSSTGGTGGGVSVSTGGTGGGVSSVSTGGNSGSGGDGGSGGDPGCLATGCPAGQYCDGDTRECNALKAAGEPCERSQHCDDLLDCLDGVCCTEDECPACSNCGSDGACSVTVQDAEDPTGAECTGATSCDSGGACKRVLGEACYIDDDCVSGHCLDGVCCGDSSCPECYDCGSDGSCSVAVLGTDDVTSECNGISTCDSRGECTPRWSPIAIIEVNEEYVPIYSTSVGNTLYFANANGYHIGYDISTGVTSEAPLNSDYCWCGYTGAAVSDGTSMFYFGNYGRMWTPGLSDTWVDVPGYGYGESFYDGEGAFAVSDGRVYRMGGRENENRLAYYDIATGEFVTDGLPEHPTGGVLGSACGGAVNGKVYVFGWGDGAFSEYDPGTNIWTEVEADPNGPSCWSGNAPAWGSYLAYADYSGIKLLDSTLLRWEPEAIPLPDTANLMTYMTMVVDGQLFVSGYEPGEQQIYVYQYMLTDAGVGSGLE
ncbi:MAG TPA: hypothetical protein VFU02_02825 [Polyangiaceae bacterium]|nr:hypothetical protein [Polyangiaceae bacterium]